MKTVVFRIKKGMIPRKVTLQSLLSLNACLEGIVWFVNKFGLEANFKEVLAEADRTTDYTTWLIGHKNDFPESKEGWIHKNIVSINDVSEDKMYIVKFFDSKHVYKSQKFDDKWYWMSIRSSTDGFKKGYDSLFDLIMAHLLKDGVKVYEIQGAIEIRDVPIPKYLKNFNGFRGTMTGRFSSSEHDFT